MHRFFCWIPYSLKNSLTKFENFLSTRSTDWEHSQPVQQISIKASSNSEHPSLFWSYLPHPDSKSCAVFFFVGLLILQGIFPQKFRFFFLNRIDQLGTAQPVHRASLRGTLFLLILEPKSYLVWAHKLHISPKHGLGPIMGHFLGCLQPTLSPFGFLLVKERSKCGQL